MRVVVSVLAIAVALATSSPAGAQDAISVGASVIYSTQSTPSVGVAANNPSVFAPGIGGSASGFIADAGLRVSSRVSFNVEWSDTGTFHGLQFNGRDVAREFDHHDRMVSGLIEAHQTVLSRLSLALASGPSFVFDYTPFRLAAVTSGPDGRRAPGPFGPENGSWTGTLALTFSADVQVALSSHVRVGPTLRGHLIPRDSFETGGIGLASTVWRFGAGCQVSF